jgi:Mg/Co/Ni transporter MgtE
MENTAKAVMQTRFKTLSPDHTIKQAVRILQSASKEYGPAGIRYDGYR